MNAIQRHIGDMFDVLLWKYRRENTTEKCPLQHLRLSTGHFDPLKLTNFLSEWVKRGFEYGNDGKGNYAYTSAALNSYPEDVIRREALEFAKSLGPVNWQSGQHSPAEGGAGEHLCEQSH